MVRKEKNSRMIKHIKKGYQTKDEKSKYLMKNKKIYETI